MPHVLKIRTSTSYSAVGAVFGVERLQTDHLQSQLCFSYSKVFVIVK